MTECKPLIVGELNPYGKDPALALYPLPRAASGARLCRLLGISGANYLRNFDRANLCVGKWRKVDAVEEAGRLLDTPRPFYVLLGRKVSDVFLRMGNKESFCVRRVTIRLAHHTFLLLPHPSGRCREWNSQVKVAQARALMVTLLIESGLMEAVADMIVRKEHRGSNGARMIDEVQFNGISIKFKEGNREVDLRAEG
jgi:hypothetical protein